MIFKERAAQRFNTPPSHGRTATTPFGGDVRHVRRRSGGASATVRTTSIGGAGAVTALGAFLDHEVDERTGRATASHGRPVPLADVGEPVAIVAANHPEVAKSAVDAIYVDYEQLDPLVNSQEAIEAAPIHPEGNVIRHLVINHGDPDAVGNITVEGEYEVGIKLTYDFSA